MLPFSMLIRYIESCDTALMYQVAECVPVIQHNEGMLEAVSINIDLHAQPVPIQNFDSKC